MTDKPSPPAVSETNVRSACHYLLHSLTELHNDYGAGGDWGGAPVPLHEIDKRLRIAESILEKGTKETLKELQDDKH